MELWVSYHDPITIVDNEKIQAVSTLETFNAASLV